MGPALVIENDPTADIRRLGEWLADEGVRLETCRPHRGEPLPADLTGYAALVVLGGQQSADAEVPWFADCERLLRKAVRYRVPTLAICLGAQLLARAHGGEVGPAKAGPELGARLVARRDVAESDPLFARVPFAPDVIQWHHDEITELPSGAVLLAASTHYPYQAFRLGPAAWGLQFHIEPDIEQVAGWAAIDAGTLRELHLDPVTVLAEADAVMGYLTDVWQPLAVRFAAVARGELAAAPRPDLPLLGE